jgi:phosphocarrier protein
MKQYTFVLNNEHGMHARPAGLFVQVSSKFESEVHLIKNAVKINAKSIIGVLRLAGVKGDQLTVEVAGPDEPEALEAIKSLLDQQFGE